MDATEAAKHPDAANKPTPHMADGHPDLNGVWHHYFMQGGYTPLKPGESVQFQVLTKTPGSAINGRAGTWTSRFVAGDLPMNRR